MPRKQAAAAIKQPDPMNWVPDGALIAGRMEPRIPPVVVEHVIRYFPSYNGSEWGIAARCNDCPDGGWRIWLSKGHTLSDFRRLEEMHSGRLGGNDLDGIHDAVTRRVHEEIPETPRTVPAADSPDHKSTGSI